MQQPERLYRLSMIGAPRGHRGGGRLPGLAPTGVRRAKVLDRAPQNIPSGSVQPWRASAGHRRAKGARRAWHVALSRSLDAVLLTLTPCGLRRRASAGPCPTSRSGATPSSRPACPWRLERAHPPVRSSLPRPPPGLAEDPHGRVKS